MTEITVNFGVFGVLLTPLIDTTTKTTKKTARREPNFIKMSEMTKILEKCLNS